jgi:hypothetical protein
MIGYSYHITTTIVIIDYYVLYVVSLSIAVAGSSACLRLLSHNTISSVAAVLLMAASLLGVYVLHVGCECVAVQAAAGLMLMGTILLHLVYFSKVCTLRM